MVKLEHEHMKTVLDTRNDILPLLKHYCCVHDALKDIMSVCVSEIHNGLSVSDMSYQICLIAAELTQHPRHMNIGDVRKLIRSDIKDLPDDKAFMYVSLLYDSATCSYYGGAENMTRSHLTFPDHSYPAWLCTMSSKKRYKDSEPKWEWEVCTRRDSIEQLIYEMIDDPLVIDLVLCASDELKQGDLFAAYEKYTQAKERTEYYKAELHAINLCALFIAVVNKRIPYLSPCITPKGLKLLYTTDKEPIQLYSGEYSTNLIELEAKPRDREYKKLTFKYISKNVQPLKEPYDVDLNDLPFTEPLVLPVEPHYTADGPIPRKAPFG